ALPNRPGGTAAGGPPMRAPTIAESAVADAPQYLVGARLREPVMPEDYLTTEAALHVGELVVVETGNGTTVAEVRRPVRPLPEFKRGRLYRRIVRRATQAEAAEWRARPRRRQRGAAP